MAVRRPCRSPGGRVTDEFSLHLLDLDTRAERTLSDLIDYGGFDLWGGLVVWIGGTLESPQVLLHSALLRRSRVRLLRSRGFPIGAREMSLLQRIV